MKFYLLVISLWSISCSLNAQNDSDKSEKNQSTSHENVKAADVLTTLDMLNSYKLDKHQLTFKSVLSDGRCPKDVTCVWAGEAEILIEINDGTETVAEKIAIPALGFEKEILSTSDHKVYLRNLAPYPMKANESIEAYQLLIKIHLKKS